jgi:hypothetical protein
LVIVDLLDVFHGVVGVEQLVIVEEQHEYPDYDKNYYVNGVFLQEQLSHFDGYTWSH